jgi:glycosyltransferase involved in cell wall biosynthesis
VRIAYVCYWNLLEKDGVAQKIETQCAEWRLAGHQAEVFCLTQADPSLATVRWRLFPFRGLLSRIAATRALQRAVVEWSPDAVYLRYDLFAPPLVRLLSVVPVVAELQTNDRAEFGARSRAVRLYNVLAAHLVLSRVAGLVVVTDEIARYRHVARHRKPVAVIGNGVDMTVVRELPPAATETPEVALVASGQPWHGVDKLVWLAGRLPEVIFHIIGVSAAAIDAAPPNLVAHGRLAREDYEPILARCDAAFGTLALHRNLMTEATPLKVREYLAYGLPVVVAYDDIDLRGDDAWYVLRLPNEESNVRDHVDEIRSFVERVRGRRVPRAEIEDRVGARAKERTRLAFVRSVVQAAS